MPSDLNRGLMPVRAKCVIIRAADLAVAGLGEDITETLEVIAKSWLR